jgi:hypothetical protein
MAANILKLQLSMTGFLDNKIASSIKPSSKNKGKYIENSLVSKCPLFHLLGEKVSR